MVNKFMATLKMHRKYLQPLLKQMKAFRPPLYMLWGHGIILMHIFEVEYAKMVLPTPPALETFKNVVAPLNSPKYPTASPISTPSQP